MASDLYNIGLVLFECLHCNVENGKLHPKTRGEWHYKLTYYEGN